MPRPGDFHTRITTRFSTGSNLWLESCIQLSYTGAFPRTFSKPLTTLVSLSLAVLSLRLINVSRGCVDLRANRYHRAILKNNRLGGLNLTVDAPMTPIKKRPNAAHLKKHGDANKHIYPNGFWQQTWLIRYNRMRPAVKCFDVYTGATNYSCHTHQSTRKSRVSHLCHACIRPNSMEREEIRHTVASFN